MTDILTKQIALEQAKIDELFAVFDVNYKETFAKLEKMVLTEHHNEEDKNRFVVAYERELLRLQAAENRMVFGKICGAQNYYIGRIGLHNDTEQLLIDWRSNVGSLFYQATASDTQGVDVRRHINLEGRKVISLDDDVLNHDNIDTNDIIVGDGALISALEQKRTGHMHDIVSTIQKEQDEIIRASYADRLVIQGTPGTGKTVVALHRIAYLLYQYRKELSGLPILFVGPNQRFMNYVSEVLPALGETGVEHRTVDSSVAGRFNITDYRPTEFREQKIKGDRIMKDALKEAIHQFVSVPAEPIKVTTPSTIYQITPTLIKNLQKQSCVPHRTFKASREYFITHLIERLVREKSPLPDLRQMLSQQLRETEGFVRMVNILWLKLTPEFFIRQILSNPKRLIAGFRSFVSESDLQYLLELAEKQVDQNGEYILSAADLPLIDYADYLINGNVERTQKLNETLVGEAQDVLENVAWTAKSMISAEELAARFDNIYESNDDYLPKYSHICVDEAQELSFMQWQVLLRRQAYESWTIVGDVYQTYSPAGTHDWSHLESMLGKLEVHTLSVNYRNPKEIAEYANAQALKYGLTPPKDIKYPRSHPNSVINVDLTSKNTADQLHKVASEYAESGLTCVIIGCDDADLSCELCEIENNDNNAYYEIFSPEDVKGLEFDNVIVVNEERIAQPQNATEKEATRSNASNLFVALTRATQKLILVIT